MQNAGLASGLALLMGGMATIGLGTGYIWALYEYFRVIISNLVACTNALKKTN